MQPSFTAPGGRFHVSEPVDGRRPALSDGTSPDPRTTGSRKGLSADATGLSTVLPPTATRYAHVWSRYGGFDVLRLACQKRQCQIVIVGLPRVASCCIFRDMRRWALHRSHTVCYAVVRSTRRCRCGPHRPPAAIQGCRTWSRAAAGGPAWCSCLSLFLSIVNDQKVSHRRDWTGGAAAS